MPSFKPRHLIALSCLLATASPCLRSVAQAPLPAAEFDKLRSSTSLDREGMHPWHLRISFQLFTLEGKKQETGTIEEWWTSEHDDRVVITSPSIPSGSDGSNRESFLVGRLHLQFVHP
ncbi:MAG: hypothetical protein V4555_11205, partial [Acidobacteriota bacterium]